MFIILPLCILRDYTRCLWELYRVNKYNHPERCKIEKETRLVVCTEEYTSKTCTRCGSVNDVGHQCSNCDLIIDRDVNGARNIFIKCVNEIM